MVSKKRLYWFTGTLTLTAMAWILSYPDYVGICPPYGVDGQYACVDRLAQITEPAALLLTALSLSFLSSIFSTPSAFRAWRLLTIIYLPTAIILIALTPQSSGNIINIDREIVTWWLSIGFVIISLVLIAYKSWQLRRNTDQRA